VTDYTILSNTAVGVGGLPSGATVTALRDNPIAIAEGSVGAPSIRLPSLGVLAAGDVSQIARNTVFTWSSNAAWGTGLSHTFIQSGTIRCTGQYKRDTGGTSQFRILRTRNNTDTVVYGPISFTNSGYVSFTVDIPILPLDGIQFQLFANNTTLTSLNLATIKTDGALDIWPLSLQLSSNNTYTGSWT
jgi:hypothetical protein